MRLVLPTSPAATPPPRSPDCPPGASADATSAKGLLLGAELSPLMDLCGSTALSGPSTTRQGSAQQQAGEDADDDMMADMAGLAAGAQDPMRAQLLARNSAAAAAAAARAAEQRLEQSSDDSPLLDTPEGVQCPKGQGRGGSRGPDLAGTAR